MFTSAKIYRGDFIFQREKKKRTAPVPVARTSRIRIASGFFRAYFMSAAVPFGYFESTDLTEMNVISDVL